MSDIIRRECGHWKTLDWDKLIIQHYYGERTTLARETFADRTEMEAKVDYYLRLNPPYVREAS